MLVAVVTVFRKGDAVRRIGLAAFIVAVMLPAAPAFAQVDLTGTWVRSSQSDNGNSPFQNDLLGIPLSADGRAKALSYDIASLSATERQCQMYPPFYAITGPFPLQISIVQDPVTTRLLGWNIAGWGDRDGTMIWMDGRPQPSQYAPHSHGGFTTGEWQGDTLTAVTTHFKMGDMKRHRAFSSDRATITYRFNRHGDILTVTGILEDPVYLAEPYVLTEIFRLTTNPNNFPLTACEPIEELPRLHENPALVLHYLPGKQPVRERGHPAVEHPARGGAGWSGDDLSGVPQEAEGQVRGTAAGRARAGRAAAAAVEQLRAHTMSRLTHLAFGAVLASVDRAQPHACRACPGTGVRSCLSAHDAGRVPQCGDQARPCRGAAHDRIPSDRERRRGASWQRTVEDDDRAG